MFSIASKWTTTSQDILLQNIVFHKKSRELLFMSGEAELIKSLV